MSTVTRYLRIKTALLGLSIGVSAASCAKAPLSTSKYKALSPADETLRTIGSQYDVSLNFAGKGTSVIWDLGIVRGLLKSVKPLQNNRAIYTGNSSGSIMAAYFSCYGMSEGSLNLAIERFTSLDRTKIPENSKAKAMKLLMGARSESDVSYLKEFIEQTLTGPDGPCTPKFPLIISTANGDVVENRVVKAGTKGPMIKPHPTLKFVEEGTFDVYQTGNGQITNETSATVDSANQSNPPEFIGKACTYFVDETMHAALSLMDRRELQCELRKVSTFRDLVYAVVASVSEPTYYYPVADMDPNNEEIYRSEIFMDAATDPFWLEQTPDESRIVAALALRPELHKVAMNKRYYVGGFATSNPGQDIRKVLPHVHVLSTGRRPLSRGTNDLLKAFYLVDANKQYQYSRWWIDMEILPSSDEEKLMADYSVSHQQIIDLAMQSVSKCIAADQIDKLGAARSCAPSDIIDDVDHSYNFLVQRPLDKHSISLKGERIEQSGRRLPLEMIADH